MDFSAERARRLLCRLQDAVRESVVAAGARGTSRLSRVAAVAASDTIYGVDRVSEETIVAWLGEHWPAAWPVELVMEGIEEGGPATFPRGTPPAATRFKLILDPIDGTRGLMYDKRSAWSLAGLAPQRGHRTSLEHIMVAAMTELPVAKQAEADQYSAVCGRGVKGERIDLRTWRRRSLAPRPSTARDVAHGFASFAKFFPEAKAWLAELEEALWRELRVDSGPGGTPVFDDQYISTGGQLAELVAGRDRMVADLRPLACARLGIGAALACHPYDLAALPVAREAGCIVEAPGGGPLRAPLDTTTPVAWVGYANAALARRIRPVLRRLLRARGAL